MSTSPYKPLQEPRSQFIDVRGLQCHVRSWGDASAQPVVLLHGSRDCSATFQFMVDNMAPGFHFIAPDLRGYGRTQWNPQGYWFADYLADLEIVLDTFIPQGKAALVGHSLGGQLAGIYAGVRPQRISKLVALDAFGLIDDDAQTAPGHLAKWLDGWKRGPEASRHYETLAEMAARLQRTNPRLPIDKALFMAAESSRRRADGLLEWSFDPLHRQPFATLYRSAEWAACMQRIEAPTLWLASDRVSRAEREPGGLAARMALVRNLTFEKIDDTSHNLHHDRPQEVARLVEAFLTKV